MANADVGDDVYGEDPSVTALERQVADLLGKEAALFVPSGTMGNQIAVRVHCEPGDEAIVESHGHSFAYETGALAALAGVQGRTVEGDRGVLSATSVKAAINPAPDHFARTRMVIIENTSNRGGGTLYDLQTIAEIEAVCRDAGLALHMDGARLWNAHAATQIALRDYCAPCDSVSVCLSKGLGAPVGSVIAGSRGFIERAHRFRKMFGGGMRQAGILAAAGTYALQHNLPRLSEDHAKLRRLSEGLADIDGIDCRPDDFPTNIAYADITTMPASEATQRLADAGVLLHAMGPATVRVVTHLDLTMQDVEIALDRIRGVFD